MPPEEHKEYICRQVKEYFERNDRPMLLSDVGAKFFENFKRPFRDFSDTTLKDFIRSELSSDLQLLTHPYISQRIFVAPRDKAAVAEEYVKSDSRRYVGGGNEEQESIDCIQNSIVLAFQQCPDGDRRVYVSLEHPVHFKVAPENPDPDKYIELEKSYLLEGAPLKRSPELTGEQRERLLESIRSWADDKGIDINTFYHRPKKQFKVETHGSQKSALERLLSCQPVDIQRRILVPLDIAELLSKKK